MLKRLFSSDPLKVMQHKLKRLSPDDKLWPQVAAYLARGRRPEDLQAKAVIRAYLDLREFLGARAAFRAGGELNHQALAKPCAEFFRAYQNTSALAKPALQKWACFCLAADFLLAAAAEVRLQKGATRRRRFLETERLLVKVQGAYLVPLAAETKKQAVPASAKPKIAESAPKTAPKPVRAA